MALKDVLNRVKGLLIVEEPVETPDVAKIFEAFGAKTAEQATIDTPGPALSEIKIDPVAEPAAITDRGLDFKQVYDAANLESTPFTAEQTLGLIRAMPGSMTTEVRRQSLVASITAMGAALGVTPETIVADATRKIAALHAYVEKTKADAKSLSDLTAETIQKLEAEIDEHKKTLSQASERCEKVEKECDRKAGELEEVFNCLGLPQEKEVHSGPADSAQ